MAISTVNPYACTGDLMTVKECLALLKETGHPASSATVTRWGRRRDVYAERHGGTLYVSWSDILTLHKEFVDRKS